MPTVCKGLSSNSSVRCHDNDTAPHQASFQAVFNGFLNKFSQAMGKANDHLDVFAVFMIQDALATDAVSRTIGLGTRAVFVDPIADRTVIR